ncbi:MAG TPA: thioredoxin [Acidimicrobiales bacterium]
MATVALTKDTFEQTLEDNEIVLIDFWAAWCGPCRAFAPVFEKVSENHPGVVFAKIDTEAEQELAGAFRIQSIPTLMAVRDSIVLYSQPGALPEEALEDIVRQISELDMEQVRQQVAEQSAAAEAEAG